MSMPLLARPTVIVVAMVYLALVLAIGFWALRRTRNARDFFIAGQRIGLLVTGLATMSAAFSGFVFLGGPGLTYRIGAAALFISIPVSFTSGMLCWVVAKRLRLLAEVREVYTIPDAIDSRYGSRAATGLAALAVVIGTVGYLGSQMLALGVLIEAIFGTQEILGAWSLPVAMTAGMVVVLAYSMAGGMLAGVYTDLFQGGLMVLTAAGVFAYALHSGGGLSAIATSIARSPEFGAGFLEPFGVVPVLTAMGFFFVFGIGTLGQPHMLHKFYMLDDPRKLKWMPLVVGAAQTACVLIWLGIGLAVPGLVAQGRMAALDNPDSATPLFLLQFTPQVLAGLAFAGILAAIMSTADSFANIGSAALVRDVPRVLGRKVRRELFWGRIATPVIMVAATLFAWLYGDLIALLGTFAFGTFGAALAPALAVGLNWKRVTAAASTASIATGLVLNLGLELLAKQTWLPHLPRPPLAPGALPAAVSLAASFTVLVVVTWLTAPRQPDLDEDIEAVLDC
jgi:Na+/proline symporter